MGTEGEVTTLGAFIKALEIGDPVGHLNLTLVPLRGDGAARIEYVLGADAIRAGTLTVTEVSEAGSVPELAVTSTDERMILLLDGEELVGAKQNRILNTSILLPQSIIAPAQCCVSDPEIVKAPAQGCHDFRTLSFRKFLMQSHGVEAMPQCIGRPIALVAERCDTARSSRHVGQVRAGVGIRHMAA